MESRLSDRKLKPLPPPFRHQNSAIAPSITPIRYLLASRMRFPVRTALRSEPASFSRAKVCSASTAQSIALLGTAPVWVPAAIAAPVELTIILGQDAPTEDQSWNSLRIECATSHGPCASRCRAHMRVFARKSAAVDPAATRGLRARRDAAL